jgi:predicted RNA-binding protein Jag
MLEPMNSVDRKTLHDAVSEIVGIRSYSEGREPYRSVVFAPSNTEEE